MENLYVNDDRTMKVGRNIEGHPIVVSMTLDKA
jgi:hypothetical protein